MVHTDIQGKVFDFEVTGVRFRHVDRASRYALSTILPDGAAESEEDRIATDQEWLIRARRGRVRQLAGAGWLSPQDPTNWKFLYNCPPTGVVTNFTGLRSCKKASICPFCWCRRHVHGCYTRLAEFYYGGAPRPNHLLEVVWGSDYPAADWTVNKLFAREIVDNRRVLVDRIKPDGAFQLITVAPPHPRKFNYWQIEIRLLAVMPSSGFDVPELGGNVTIRHHTSVSRDTLVGAVGRTCSYPKQLFFGPVKETAELANFYDGFGRSGKKVETRDGGTQIKGFRMTSTYGDLRRG